MRELLQTFDYIERYHANALESLAVITNLFIVLQEARPGVLDVLAQRHTKADLHALYEKIALKILSRSPYTPPHPKLNLQKIFKALVKAPFDLPTLEWLVHTITIRRTLNKLYIYSTPMEVNHLITQLLAPSDGDEIYNPCYGMGTLFLSLAQSHRSFTLFGEEIDSKLAQTAQLMARAGGLHKNFLHINDLLQNPAFKTDNGFRKFSKIVCNPPFSAHFGVESLRGDERFARYGVLAKSSPELVFLTHSLMHLKGKGVFIVRNQVLQKSFLEEKLREQMVRERVIEAIIELPKNIFPHQSHDLSLLIISSNNSAILHIDATSEHFWEKDGKYHRLRNYEEIVAIYQDKKVGIYSSLTPIEQIDAQNLRASNYLRSTPSMPSTTLLFNIENLASLKPKIFRGQRVYGGANDDLVEYLDVGVQHFSPLAFTDEQGLKRSLGQKSKITQYALKPFDILLPLRGHSPKVTILGPSYAKKLAVANAGIVVVRLQNSLDAIALYLFLFSKAGQEVLNELYLSANHILPLHKLEQIPLPGGFYEDLEHRMSHLQDLQASLAELERSIEAVRSRSYLDSTSQSDAKSPILPVIPSRR